MLWLLATERPTQWATFAAKPLRAGVDPRTAGVCAARSAATSTWRAMRTPICSSTRFPYGAHTTTNDALFWPDCRCSPAPARRWLSRIAGSQLHAIGLPELVTASLAEYEALALRLAREPETLAALRARLAANRQHLPAVRHGPLYARLRSLALAHLG